MHIEFKLSFLYGYILHFTNVFEDVKHLRGCLWNVRRKVKNVKESPPTSLFSIFGTHNLINRRETKLSKSMGPTRHLGQVSKETFLTNGNQIENCSRLFQYV